MGSKWVIPFEALFQGDIFRNCLENALKTATSKIPQCHVMRAPEKASLTNAMINIPFLFGKVMYAPFRLMPFSCEPFSCWSNTGLQHGPFLFQPIETEFVPDREGSLPIRPLKFSWNTLLTRFMKLRFVSACQPPKKTFTWNDKLTYVSRLYREESRAHVSFLRKQGNHR